MNYCPRQKSTQNSIVINKLYEINDVVSPNYVMELDSPAVGHVEKEKKEKWRIFCVITCLKKVRNLVLK